jgi:hypothetical protein
MDRLKAKCESAYLTEELIKARLYERDERNSQAPWHRDYHTERAVEHLVNVAESLGFDLIRRDKQSEAA